MEKTTGLLKGCRLLVDAVLVGVSRSMSVGMYVLYDPGIDTVAADV